MNDKIITYADLSMLRSMRAAVGSPEAELLDRLIAAAEADLPPLPEGWVVYTTPSGIKGVFWHRDGALYRWDANGHAWGYVEGTPRDRLTPLRPAVTEADVEKAARAARAAFFIADHWDKDRMIQGEREEWKRTTRAAFKAVGIEVTS